MVEAKFVVYGQAEHFVGVTPPYFTGVGEEGVEVNLSRSVALDVKVGHGCLIWVGLNTPLQLPKASGG